MLGGGSGDFAGAFARVEAEVRSELEWVTCDEATLGLSRVRGGFFARVASTMCAARREATKV